jgi:general secretion pathway protein G
MTLLELVMVCAILLILATAALPIARITAKRQQEAELRVDLREMRNAIDRYKDAADRNLFQVDATTDGYPPDLNTLVQGVDVTLAGAGGAGIGTPIGAGAAGNAAAPATSASPFSSSPSTSSSFGQSDTNSSGAPITMHVRFLRKIPIDPMTGKADWGLRSVQDDPDSDAWGGQDVFDVYSLSSGIALDSSKYSGW